MIFKTIFKYGIPFSFVYCTIYQQDVWREGSDELIQEQKRVWRNFFNTIDSGYQTTVAKLTRTDAANRLTEKRVGLISAFDSLDVRKCWNTKVYNTFATIDQVVTSPKVIACKVYRKVQPYISKPASSNNSKTEPEKTATE